MPPVGTIWNLDWLNANSQRKYPLSETAGVKDTTGSFAIPNDFIVDLLWPIHADPTIDPTKFHVRGIGIFGTGVTIAIAYDGTVIANVSIDAATHTPNSVYPVQGTGEFFDTLGKIIIGSLETVRASAGSFLFDLDNGRFEPIVIRPDIRGVSALYIKNGEDVSEPIQNDVILSAGRNCQLVLVPGPANEPARVTINAIDGEGLNEDCECNDAVKLPCIKTINNLGPDLAGDFSLLGDDCLALEAISNGIQITEKCAKPCCGCDELGVVIDATQNFAADVFSLENLASRLEAHLQVLETNLIASKTGTQQ